MLCATNGDQWWQGTASYHPQPPPHPRETYLLIIKRYVMNGKNLEALKKSMLGLGFGEGMNEQLEKSIREQKPDFTLQSAYTYNNKPMQVELSFKKGNENDMYFFNKYNAKLGDRELTFYMNRGEGVTTKEAFNLLEGRAVNKNLVNKEGEKYNSWLQFDFTKKDEKEGYQVDRYHNNYGYD